MASASRVASVKAVREAEISSRHESYISLASLASIKSVREAEISSRHASYLSMASTTTGAYHARRTVSLSPRANRPDILAEILGSRVLQKDYSSEELGPAPQ